MCDANKLCVEFECVFCFVIEIPVDLFLSLNGVSLVSKNIFPLNYRMTDTSSQQLTITGPCCALGAFPFPVVFLHVHCLQRLN